MTEHNDSENSLATAVAEGLILDVSGTPERFISASAIRRVILDDDRVKASSFSSLILVGADIDGCLDLEDVEVPVSLRFTRCRFRDRLYLERANLRLMALEACTLTSVDGEGACWDGDLRIEGCTAQQVDISYSKINGSLSLNDSTIISTEGEAALSAAGVSIDKDVALGGCVLYSPDLKSSLSAANLSSSMIAGTIYVRDASIHARTANSLNLDRARVGGDLRIRDSRITGGQGEGLILQSGSFNSVSVIGSNLSSKTGSAIQGSSMSSATDFVVTDCYCSSTDGTQSTVNVQSAKCGGIFRFAGTRILNSSSSAISMHAVEAAQLVLCEGSELQARSTGYALHGLSLQVRENVFVENCKIENPDGAVVSLRGSEVGGSIILGAGLEIYGGGAGPLVTVEGAKVKDNLRVRITDVQYDLSGLKVVVSLRNVSVEGDFFFDARRFSADRRLRLNVDGLRFRTGPSGTTVDHWLEILRCNTARYYPQPYRQVAQVAKEAGHEWDWRKSLIHQNKDLRRRGKLGGRFARIAHGLSGLFISYGYRSYLALFGLLACFLIAFGTVQLVDSDGDLGRLAGVQPYQCSFAEKIQVAGGSSIPLINLNARRSCDLIPGRPYSQKWSMLLVLTQVGGWAFTTLFVAGFTGLVRKVN